MPKEDQIFAVCATCNGPIYSGEPIVTDGAVISHRFSTWCDYYRGLDAKFAAAAGIKLD